jgi:NAD(P)H-dependent FMN reductase
MKIVAIVGSLRKESYNKKISEFIKERFKEKLEIEIVLLNDLPMFNQDIEKNPPKEVKDFKAKIKSADGVLFVTPEYNHSIPGVLKNALDWCSREDRPLANKPTFIVGASDGNVGTARCQGDLRKVLNGPGVATLNLPGNLVVIGNGDEKFNESGEFIDERTIKRLDSVIENFIEWVEKVK